MHITCLTDFYIKYSGQNILFIKMQSYYFLLFLYKKIVKNLPVSNFS